MQLRTMKYRSIVVIEIVEDGWWAGPSGCWTFSQGLPNVAKVALPLVRQGELNPEDEDLFCTSLFRNQSAHK